MDIQKEREAFEESNNVKPDWSFKFDDELQQYVELDHEMQAQVEEINEHWDTFRAGWQAAKAQADQKIKLLLCDEHLKKCESPTGVFNSQYPDEEPCLICLAKAAKAQAVPDLGELQERIAGHQYYHYEHGHMIVDMDDVVKEISGFDSWKAQAVPEWFDYTKQSPQIDGNYQIFIKGEQITAKWVSRFGFADPIEGDALRQELITHWAMQPQPPKAQEPVND